MPPGALLNDVLVKLTASGDGPPGRGQYWTAAQGAAGEIDHAAVDEEAAGKGVIAAAQGERAETLFDEVVVGAARAS